VIEADRFAGPLWERDGPAKARSARWPGMGPLLEWLVALLLLPLVAFHFVRSMARKQNNSSNAFRLAVFLALDLLMAALLFGMQIPDWMWAALTVGALAYNICVMTFALKLES